VRSVHPSDVVFGIGQSYTITGKYRNVFAIHKKIYACRTLCRHLSICTPQTESRNDRNCSASAEKLYTGAGWLDWTAPYSAPKETRGTRGPESHSKKRHAQSSTTCLGWGHLAKLRLGFRLGRDLEAMLPNSPMAANN